jgi:hypothetical protein
LRESPIRGQCVNGVIRQELFLYGTARRPRSLRPTVTSPSGFRFSTIRSSLRAPWIVSPTTPVRSSSTATATGNGAPRDYETKNVLHNHSRIDDHQVGKAEVYPGMTLPVANRIVRLHRPAVTHDDDVLERQPLPWGPGGHDCENPWGHDPEKSHLGARHRIPLNNRTRSQQPVIWRSQYPEARTPPPRSGVSPARWT